MTDHDQTLGDTTPTSDVHPLGAAVDQINGADVKPFSLDELMAEGRLVERTAKICIRGDLEQRHDELLQELATLVDQQGKPLDPEDEEASLGEGSRVRRVHAELTQVKAERAEWMRTFKFRAMPADEWAEFEKLHRDKNDDQVKDIDEYRVKIIARCAVEPTLTEDQVRSMRKKLTGNQITYLGATAYQVNTLGGLDVPKSPGFLRGLEHRLSEKS